MIQCPACLPDVYPWALATEDAVHHPFPLLLWDRVFQMDLPPSVCTGIYTASLVLYYY